MNFINPFGRTVGDGVQPQACMCSEDFASYRDDQGSSCWSCGCGCDTKQHDRGNKKTAANACHKSE